MRDALAGLDIRRTAQQPEFLAKRSATQKIHKQAIRNWNPSDLPGWLTREAFIQQVQPALSRVPKARLAPPSASANHTQRTSNPAGASRTRGTGGR